MKNPSRPAGLPLFSRTAVILVVLFLPIAAYLNTLKNGFVWDDKLQVLANQWIRDISYIPDIFRNCVWSFCGASSSYYRPVMHLVYMADYHLFGLAPWGFHLTNVLMNAAVCVIVYLVADKLVRDHGIYDRWAANFLPIATAAVFVVHPVHSEPVAYVAGVPDITYGFFFLLSFYLYMASFRSDGRLGGISLAGSASAFFIAMLCKEPAVTLPGILLCYDYTTKRFKGNSFRQFARYLPFIAAVFAYFAIRHAALGVFFERGPQTGLMDAQKAINSFLLFTQYLKLMLLPVNLSAFYDIKPASSVFEPKVLTAAISTTVFIIIMVYLLRKRSIAAVGLTLIALPLTPALFVTDLMKSPMADRYLYVPVMGFGLLLSMSVAYAVSRAPGTKRLCLAALAALTAIYLSGTVARNKVWYDDYTMSSDAIIKAPGSSVPHTILGLALFKKGRIDEAEAELKTAISLGDKSSSPHVNLAAIYTQKGMIDQSVSECNAAIAINPESDEVRVCMANNYIRMGELDRAENECKKAIAINPYYAKAYNVLGGIYGRMGRMDDAVDVIQKAIALRPRYAKAYINLGVVYASTGRPDMAAKQFKKTISLNPESVFAHSNLGIAYMRMGMTDLARAQFERALELKPDDNLSRRKLDELKR